MSAPLKYGHSVFSRTIGFFCNRPLISSFAPVSHKFGSNDSFWQITSNKFHSLFGIPSTANLATLAQMAICGPFQKKRPPNKVMNGKPFIKGIVLKAIVRKPKKPNSANRKCVRVRLSDGREITAHIPGEGHNLQEHNLVLVRGGRTQDLIGVKHKVVRGKYDCAPIQKPSPK
ncbi:unnamed protein product [Heterobilharzia americana]|nr:unnamed protein product [Heterobilharzia americana]CAH8659614.1 unnamed protein product [Heterobilharzia americana]